jgi:hypothetical protein
MQSVAERHGRAARLLAVCSAEVEQIRHSANSVYGVCRHRGERRFFKCLPLGQAINERHASEELQSYFPSPRLIEFVADRATSEGALIQEFREGLFDHADSAHNYLCDATLSFASKSETVERFWARHREVLKGRLVFKRLLSTEFPAAMLTTHRVWNGRMDRFYGSEYHQLFDDVALQIGMDGSVRLRDWAAVLLSAHKEGYTTWCSVTHGDLHDLNCGFEPLYYDLTTAGLNPVLEEIACYHWYAVAEGDHFIPRYDPSGFRDMSSRIPLHVVRVMATEIFNEQLALPLIAQLNENHSWRWRDELAFYLLARMLGVYDVLAYEAEDRRRVYELLTMLHGWSRESTRGLSLPFAAGVVSRDRAES